MPQAEIDQGVVRSGENHPVPASISVFDLMDNKIIIQYRSGWTKEYVKINGIFRLKIAVVIAFLVSLAASQWHVSSGTSDTAFYMSHLSSKASQINCHPDTEESSDEVEGPIGG